MAQRTEKEETEYKVVLENISNLCLKCFHAAAAASTSVAAKPSNHVFAEKSLRSRSSPERKLIPARASRDLKEVESVASARREVNRCSGRRRKVGLTRFRCRCDDLFCAEHQYSDRHDCSYDYKSSGREAISRDNPVVKATKIVRI